MVARAAGRPRRVTGFGRLGILFFRHSRWLDPEICGGTEKSYPGLIVVAGDSARYFRPFGPERAEVYDSALATQGGFDRRRNEAKPQYC